MKLTSQCASSKREIISICLNLLEKIREMSTREVILWRVLAIWIPKCWQNFTIFDPYSSSLRIFLPLSVGKFNHFLTHPSLKMVKTIFWLYLKNMHDFWPLLPSHQNFLPLSVRKFDRYFAVFKECARFWPLLPSCWKFFATIHRQIYPVFYPSTPKNVDVLKIDVF